MTRNRESAIELPIPAAVSDAGRALELLRVWLVDGNQLMVISPSLWKDPASWGLLLVDLAREVAAAYEAQGRDRGETFDRILQGFRAEVEHPTD